MMRVRMFVVALMALVMCWQAQAVEKKLIAIGWDMPNAEALRAHYAERDKLPFRGTSLRFSGRGGTPFLDFAHGRDIWKPEDIDQIIEDFRAAKPERYSPTASPLAPGSGFGVVPGFAPPMVSAASARAAWQIDSARSRSSTVRASTIAPTQVAASARACSRASPLPCARARSNMPTSASRTPW